MNRTIVELHKAAQYLSAAAISFVPPKQDDSHTNLGWNTSENRMETHSFGAGCQLGLNLNTGNLEWMESGEVAAVIDLNANHHDQVIDWIKQMVRKSGINLEYRYSFHYELPYPFPSAKDIFSLDSEDMKEIANGLTKAQRTFESFLNLNELRSSIRIWSHHFDLGIYTQLDGDLYMGAGLAVPDSLVADFYFYASGYKNGKSISTSGFGPVESGEWRKDWNGATFISRNRSFEEIVKFLGEAKSVFQENQI